MKYLRKFETEAEIAMSVLPNVVLAKDTGRIIYNVINGVFIQHIDGTLYTTDEWTAGGFSNDLANGVAVGNGAVKFVIAKTIISTKVAWSSDTSNAVDGVMLTSDTNAAEKDYAGMANTKLIAATDTSGAAYICAHFEFPNGTKGYLPALGELYIAYKNKSAINNAMALIGGANLGTTYYWSSTQHSATRAWAFNVGEGNSANDFKSGSGYVRVFAAL